MDNDLIKDDIEKNMKIIQDKLNINLSNTNIEDKFDNTDSERINGGFNKVFYGVPGTGKSYAIEQELKEIKDENKFRITFHPEYTYNDFIGQLLPKVDSETNTITYGFQEGQFTLALKRAYENPTEKIYLIIEEMSRGNCAAIFGDIFQLLDREKDGKNKDWSSYSINNALIASKITNASNNMIKIPSNMFIYGTVNTSDQNVFVMDNAFKRRFEWKYISTNPELDGNGIAKNNYKIKIIDSDNIINVTWINLYQTLNKYISLKEYLDLGEDKQIGQFFIEFDNNDDRNNEKIRDKLLHYLWFDVRDASYKSNVSLFDEKISSFSTLYDNYNKNIKIFSDDFIFKLKEN